MNSQPEIAKRIMQLFEGVDGVKVKEYAEEIASAAKKHLSGGK